MTLNQAAKILGVSKQWVHHLYQQGRIKARWINGARPTRCLDIAPAELARFRKLRRAKR
jgi:hypothetical protein